MQEGRTVFGQLMDFVPRYEFDKCVARYEGDKHIRQLSCYEHFLIMGFAQLTRRESLREIEVSLKALGTKRYHSGIQKPVSKSTLAEANEKRDWQIYGDFARVLIAQATQLYSKEPMGVDLQNAAYALDSTTIDLCMTLFPWAKFKSTKSAVKMHTLLNLRGNFPSLVIITHGKIHDVNILDQIPLEAGAFYVMDRAYVDFTRLYHLHQNAAFFVTRTKCNFQFRRRASAPVDKASGIRFDQTGILTGQRSRKVYPDTVRRISFVDPDTHKKLEFLTNNLSQPALVIAQLYRQRWQVELFFKWMKQHLRIKNFYGTSSNAVKTQICISICMYVLIAIVRKKLKLTLSLYTILQILDVTLFEKTPILRALSLETPHPSTPDDDNQPCLQGF